MTPEEAKRSLLAWAAGELGTREGENNRNPYAALPEMTRLLGWDAQCQPWCNIFVNAAFVAVFGLELGARMLYQSVGEGSALCRQSAQFFRDHGAYGTRPEPGDVVFFYAGGEINHMGLVSCVVGGTLITVEGNCGDRVAECCYSLTDARIAGYGRPDWSLAADREAVSPAIETAETAERYVLRFEALRRGSLGEGVRAAQLLLIGRGFSCGPDGADGDFGPNTENALRRFQAAKGVPADGVLNAVSAAALYGGTIEEEGTGT